MTRMRSETLEMIEVAARQLRENTSILHTLKQHLTDTPPDAVVTVARGSSDHASIFARYLFETEFGLVTSSAAPSVYTLYHARMQLQRCFMIALSQSGQSPDLCEVMRVAKEQNALSIALVNETDSPLAKLAQITLPLRAGPEKAVAATKSYMAMLFALLHMTAILKDNTALQTDLENLPNLLSQLTELDFNQLLLPFLDARTALVIGRGFGFAIAEEIALKFKEVTQTHAEAFSSAEVLHGPFSLFSESFPVVIFLQNDASLTSLHQLLDKIKATPAKPLLLGDAAVLKGYTDLPHILLPETNPLITPILAAFVMYQFLEQLALKLGLDPDSPPLIQKVTRTL